MGLLQAFADNVLGNIAVGDFCDLQNINIDVLQLASLLIWLQSADKKC